MFRLSRITDYGIVLMAHIAEQGDDSLHTARDLADQSELPLPVVSKILKSLTREGLLRSHRGSKGGYSLKRSAAEITVPELITALDGPIHLTECASHSGACAKEASCHVREPWQRINAAVEDALSRITLGDLISPVPGRIFPLLSLGVDTREIDTTAEKGRV